VKKLLPKEFLQGQATEEREEFVNVNLGKISEEDPVLPLEVSRDSHKSSEFQFDSASERSSQRQGESSGKRRKVNIHKRMTVKGKP